MKSKRLPTEVKKCKTVQDCIGVATMDCYDEYEEIEGWIACLDELFKKGAQVGVLDTDAEFVGFELVNNLCLAAKCRKGRRVAHVALESVEFKKLTATQKLWLKAWTKVARSVVTEP